MKNSLRSSSILHEQKRPEMPKEKALYRSDNWRSMTNTTRDTFDRKFIKLRTSDAELCNKFYFRRWKVPCEAFWVGMKIYDDFYEGFLPEIWVKIDESWRDRAKGSTKELPVKDEVLILLPRPDSTPTILFIRWPSASSQFSLSPQGIHMWHRNNKSPIVSQLITSQFSFFSGRCSRLMFRWNVSWKSWASSRRTFDVFARTLAQFASEVGRVDTATRLIPRSFE